MSKQSYKVAVLGLGRIGQIHSGNLHQLFPHIRVTAVTSSDTGRAFATRQTFPEVTDDFDSVLQDEAVRAVVICSPSDTHAQYVEASARAGKAIFCEKPLDLSLPVIRRIGEVVEAAGVPLMLGFNKRFDPHLAGLKAALRAGRIGAPRLLKITSRDPAPPPISYIRSSGGIHLDMIIHDFDTARFLLEREVRAVFSRGAVLVDPEIGQAGDVDTVVTILAFDDGLTAVIDNSRQAAYGYDQRVEILGAGGMLQMNNVVDDTTATFDDRGGHSARFQHFFLERYAQAYRNEMRTFIEQLENNLPMPVGVEDGFQSTAIAIAARRSLAEQRMVSIREVI